MFGGVRCVDQVCRSQSTPPIISSITIAILFLTLLPLLHSCFSHTPIIASQFALAYSTMSHNRSKSTPKETSGGRGAPTKGSHQMTTRTQGPAQELELPKRTRNASNADASQTPESPAVKKGTASANLNPPAKATPVKPSGRQTQAALKADIRDAMSTTLGVPGTPSRRRRNAITPLDALPPKGLKGKEVPEDAIEDDDDDEEPKGKGKKGA